MRTQKQITRKHRAVKFAQIAAISAAFGIAIVTGVATFLVFPSRGISFAIAVGLAGLVIELKTYWHDTQKASAIIFAKGIFANLENNLITRELLANTETKNFFEQQMLVDINKKSLKKFIKNTLENNNTLALKQSYKEKIKKELLIKKMWSAIALSYAIFNGISTVAITYTHTNLIMKQIATSWFTSLLTVLFALMCGYAYSQMMYRLLSHTIEKNSFKKLFYSLKKTFAPKKSFSSMSSLQLILFFTQCLVIGSMFSSVLALSTFVTFFSGATLLNQNVIFLQAMVHLFTNLNYAALVAINVVSSVLIYGFFLPTAFLFSFENSWEIVHDISKKILSILSHPTHTKDYLMEKITLIRNEPKQLWKLPGLLIGTLIVTVALLLHVIGEGARSSESLIDRTRTGLKFVDHISHFFEKITDFTANLFNTSAALFTVVSESTIEILEHLPFLQDGHHHGGGVSSFCANSTYHLMNRLFEKNNQPISQSVTSKSIEESETEVIESNLYRKFLSFFKLPKPQEPDIEMELLITPQSSF